MKFISPLIFIFLFISCSPDKKTQIKSELPRASVQIVDTLEVEYQGDLKIADYNQEKKLFLSIDASREFNVIVVFDKKGSIKSTFDNRNAGENAVRGKINAISFNKTNNGFIIIASGGLYYFNSSWEIYKHISIPDEMIYTRYNSNFKLAEIRNENNNFIITQLLTKSTGHNIETKEHYDYAKLLTLINLNDSSFNLKVGFDKTSNYRTEPRLYSPYFSFFDYYEKEEKVVFTLTNEKKLYFYNVDQSGNLILDNTYEYDFDYYKIYSDFNYGDNLDIYKAAFDSRIGSVYSYSNRIFINYTKAIDKIEFEKALQSYNDNQNIQNILLKNYQNCLHIIEDRKKAYQDVVLPDILTTPAAIISNDEILFHISKSKYEFNNELFFLTKIDEL